MQLVHHVIIVHCEGSPGFSLEVQLSGCMNSLLGGHLSKEDSSFGPKGIHFTGTWLYSITYQCVHENSEVFTYQLQ